MTGWVEYSAAKWCPALLPILQRVRVISAHGKFEMDAVHVMGKEFAQALVKTIKFRENPSPEELLKQLELVTQKFERIVENARNLKIGLERKWVGGAQQG